MATSKPIRKFRSWSSVDSVDPNDVRRLYNPEQLETKSPGRCISTWTFSLIILIIAVFFLVGLFVGYYVRDNQPYYEKETTCDLNQRSDKLNQDQLVSVHDNVIYFMSSEKIRQFVGQLKSSADQTTNSEWDIETAEIVKTEFEKYRLEKVEVQKYNVGVTYPTSPNRLEIINVTDGHTTLNVSITGKVTSRSSPLINSTQDRTQSRPPFVAFSPSGVVQGHLVNGNYGRELDIIELHNSNISTEDAVVLLKLGRIPISEKVRIAAEAGAVAVLLYRDPADTDFPDPEDYTPYESARPSDGTDLLPIPTQTVSVELVRRITSELSKENHRNGQTDGMTSEKSTDRPGINSGMKGDLVVKVIVNNIYHTEQVTNVIGSVYGDMEADSFVVLGASRTKFPDGETDVRLGTAHLLEMAHALSEIKSSEDWRPRRGIRFCSWGGSELSHAGLAEYLKVNQHLFPKQTVTYIDLDLSISQRRSQYSSLDIVSSPALSNLILSALEEIPDPSYKQLSLADRQQRQNANDVSHLNSGIPSPLILSHGVTMIHAGYQLSSLGTENDKESSEVLHDAEHHYKYHLAAARVIALITLRLVDDDNLAFNMVQQSKYISEAVKKTVSKLTAQQTPINKEKLDQLLTAVAGLVRTAEAFETYISTHIHSEIPLASHQMNEIKLLFNKIFISPAKYRLSVPLLYHTSTEGDLSLIKDVTELASVTGNWKDVQDLLHHLNLAITEATNSFQLS